MRSFCCETYKLTPAPERLCRASWELASAFERLPFELMDKKTMERTVVVREDECVPAFPEDFPGAVLFMAGYLGLLDGAEMLVIVKENSNSDKLGALVRMGGHLLYDSHNSPKWVPKIPHGDFVVEYQGHSVLGTRFLHYRGELTEELVRLAGARKLDEEARQTCTEIARIAGKVLAGQAIAPESVALEVAGKGMVGAGDMLFLAQMRELVFSSPADAAMASQAISEDALKMEPGYAPFSEAIERFEAVKRAWLRATGESDEAPVPLARDALDAIIEKQRELGGDCHASVEAISYVLGIDCALEAEASGTPREFL